MRKLLLILLVIIINYGAQAENLLIKLKKDSPQYSLWANNGRNEFSDNALSFLGTYKSEAYISNSLLQMLRSHSSKQTNNTLAKRSSSLDAIVRITLPEELDAALLATKINQFDWVEYAEVEPQSHLFYVPNDLDLNNQYYLRRIQAFDAWDLIDTTKSIIIGIVDTGVDYLHKDLADNIYNNPGECGLDTDGQDKRYNKIDDDSDGYIDNWRGWDFVSDSTSGQDNDPYPGNTHGTHVSGIAGAKADNYLGIAGVGYNPKILPVKVGKDDTHGMSIYNGYQGILFAALSGAKIINCSWGSLAGSKAENEIINTVLNMEVLIVAAAGNDGSNVEFYPSSYNGVLSVASTDSLDLPSSFTNFNSKIGVAAPGSFIYSCMCPDYYGNMDGTSMASPVVAGVAALVKNKFPNYSAKQIAERIKATSDLLVFGNPSYERYLGWGRVNAYKALSTDKAYSITIEDLYVDGKTPNGIYDRGNQFNLSFSITNNLDNETSIKVSVRPKNNNTIEFLNDTMTVGNLNSFESKLVGDFSFKVLTSCPADYREEIIIRIKGDNFDRELVKSIVLCPSYRNLSNEFLSYTINSRGNLAFNDYPSNQQGIGLVYKDNMNILTEGAVIAGVAENQVSDGARGVYTSYQNNDFLADTILGISNNSIAKYAKTTYHSIIYDIEATVKVDFVGILPDGDNGTLMIYKVQNTSNSFADSLCFGLFYDWDIINPHRNTVYWDNENQLGIAEYSDSANSVKAAVKRLYPPVGNFFAIDNDGDTKENPGIYDGYTDKEKWEMISGVSKREVSTITDASMVISGGPIPMDAGDAEYFVFAMTFGNDKSELAQKMQNLESFASEQNVFQPLKPYFPSSSRIIRIYPNPVKNDVAYCLYAVTERDSYVKISIYDALGMRATTIYEGSGVPKGKHVQKLDLSTLANGAYFIKIETDNDTDCRPIVIQR